MAPEALPLSAKAVAVAMLPPWLNDKETKAKSVTISNKNCRIVESSLGINRREKR